MRRTALPGLALLLILAGCTTESASAPPPAASSPSAPRAASSSAPASAAPASPAPARPRASNSVPTPSTTPAPRPRRNPPSPREKPHPISVQALIEKSYNGRDLRLGDLLDDTGAYRRYLVSYRSEGLTVSGVMNVPDGDGPFPVLVLAHGYIDPDVYVAGQGLRREQDYLARQGYVVLHTDYRGHASGDDDPDVDYELRLPYAVDVINAARAVKRSKLDFLDGDRVGVLGRSMGGNVVLNALVSQPGVFDAAVIYASTSSLAAENWEQFSSRSEDRRRVNRRIERTYGLPEESPEFWRAASPRDYFDRVTTPLQVHHGRLDDTCPLRWSREIIRGFRAEGKEVDYHFYSGEGHAFVGQWDTSIRRSRAFFDQHLR